MKTRLKIDLTIDEEQRMSGEVEMKGSTLLIVSALLQISIKNPRFGEIISVLNEIMNDENTAQNN